MITIPRTRIKSLTLRPLPFGSEQQGPLGGASLRVPVLGDRFAVDVVTAQLLNDDSSLDLSAALFGCTADDGKIAIRQPNLPSGLPSIPGAVVDTANQGGNAVKLRGLPVGASIRKGRLFNIVHNGRAYLFMTQGTVVADGAGKATVPIWPLLRFLTIDGEPCEFNEPVIAGKVTLSDGLGFSANRTEPFKFSIEERQ